MAKRKKTRKDRQQLAFDLDGVLKSFEDSFAIRLEKLFNKYTTKIFDKAKSLGAMRARAGKLGKKEVKELKGLLNGYYKQIGKASIRELNKEIKELTGKTVKIKVPDINQNLRYRAEIIARRQITQFKKDMREAIDQADLTKVKKADIKRVLRKASKLFIHRHVTITSRNEAVKAANYQRIQAVKGSKIVKGFQFLAVLDDNTTDICESRNLKVIKQDSPSLGAYIPPLHHGCRSLLSPVTIYEPNIKHTPVKELNKIAQLYPPDFGKGKKYPKKAA